LDWDVRKKAYLEKLKTESDVVKLVSLADKVHNARAILRDLEEEGDAIWARFNGGKARTVSYYQSLANIFDKAPYPSLKMELRDLVEEIITIANLRETGL
jgi:(p)ppGpp synthase/HD superfamily hydrolase